MSSASSLISLKSSAISSSFSSSIGFDDSSLNLSIGVVGVSGAFAMVAVVDVDVEVIVVAVVVVVGLFAE